MGNIILCKTKSLTHYNYFFDILIYNLSYNQGFMVGTMTLYVEGWVNTHKLVQHARFLKTSEIQPLFGDWQKSLGVFPHYPDFRDSGSKYVKVGSK